MPRRRKAAPEWVSGQGEFRPRQFPIKLHRRSADTDNAAMHVDFEDLIPLREVLYGPNGLYPLVTRAEVKEKIGPILKRKAWRGSRLRLRTH